VIIADVKDTASLSQQDSTPTPLPPIELMPDLTYSASSSLSLSYVCAVLMMTMTTTIVFSQ